MKHIVAFSGGKDSTAMLLRMIELKMPIDMILFADTTLEFPEMYEWINKIQKIIPYKITRVKAKHTFDSWFYGIPKKGKLANKHIRGFPLTVYPCWWARDSKIKPMDNASGKGNVIYIGIAKDEAKRAKAKMYQNKPNTYKFPLIEWGWKEADCLKYLKTLNLKHPLYKIFKRTGCWLCPKQSKDSLKNLCIHYPKLWTKLKKYEKDSPKGFKPDFSLKYFEKTIDIKSIQKKL